MCVCVRVVCLSVCVCVCFCEWKPIYLFLFPCVFILTLDFSFILGVAPWLSFPSLCPHHPLSLYLPPPSILPPSLFLSLLCSVSAANPGSYTHLLSASLCFFLCKFDIQGMCFIYEWFSCWLHPNPNGWSGSFVIRLCVLMNVCGCCVVAVICLFALFSIRVCSRISCCHVFAWAPPYVFLLGRCVWETSHPLQCIQTSRGLVGMDSNFQTLPLCLSNLRLLKQKEEKNMNLARHIAQRNKPDCKVEFTSTAGNKQTSTRGFAENICI